MSLQWIFEDRLFYELKLVATRKIHWLPICVSLVMVNQMFVVNSFSVSRNKWKTISLFLPSYHTDNVFDHLRTLKTIPCNYPQIPESSLVSCLCLFVFMVFQKALQLLISDRCLHYLSLVDLSIRFMFSEGPGKCEQTQRVTSFVED